MKKEAKDVLKEKFDLDVEKLSKRAQRGLNDVENNHNWCWTRDLYEKNKNNLDAVAIFYRGSKITYREIFEKAEQYAAAFINQGIKKGMEVPMCMSNCPEFLYTIMGLNLIGAKMNCFGEFDKDYLTEIINECDSNLIVCTDDKYGYIKDSINDSNTKKIIMVSLTDSLKNGKDPYIEIDQDFYDFKNRVYDYKKEDERICSVQEFLGENTHKNVKKIIDYNEGMLDTEFLVTYSSGSTNAKRPKAIVHANRSLITIGRFQDADMSDLPPMKNLVGEAMIPTHSNTGIISSMSDVLYKGCTVALEPIYDKDFFLPSLAINKPNYIAAPRNMIVDGMKKIYGDTRYKDFKMPYMMMLTSVGEPTSMGEEKFINKMMRKAKAGTAKLPRPLSPVPLSIGGGDCERGGMFFTPYRKFQDLLPKYKLSGQRCALKKYDMVQLGIIDENGKYLPYGSVGRLVAKTPTQMIGYKNNPEANEKFYIRTYDGNLWTDCNVYAYIEKNGTVDILERIGKEIILDDGCKIPLYLVGKEVEKDTKNILSYEIANVDNIMVVHIEKQPNSKKDISKILYGIEQRIQKKYGLEVSDKVVYRIRAFEEGFPSTSCEKRSNQTLVDEGLTELCVKPIMLDNGKISLLPAFDYFEKSTPKQLTKINKKVTNN